MKRPAKACFSPFEKQVKLGKHTLVITATSAAGIADPTPAEVRFKIVTPE